MNNTILLVMALTFIIGTIGTLAYSVRIVGVKTGRIAVAFSVFNILALVSRTANVIQAPLLTKTIEKRIEHGNATELLGLFRGMLLTGTFAAIFGALLLPTFIKVFTKAVTAFSTYRSIPKVIIHGFSKAGIEQFKASISIPNRSNFSQLTKYKTISKRIMVLNVIAGSISSVGVMASLYAACLNPSLRATCTNLSSVINSGATILLFIFIDPYMSMLTDDVVKGECTELIFNRTVIFIVWGQIIGTLLAQFILVPSAYIISYIAKLI